MNELLLNGLRKLEYRGYDSAGISVITEDRIEAVRAVGNLDALQAKLGLTGSDGSSAVALASSEIRIGIGHTRWAT
ncbi:MAG TPA: glutamine--fructose-6-phosphate aminotransferase, partial [Solirubrobacteraceae bacterium]